MLSLTTVLRETYEWIVNKVIGYDHPRGDFIPRGLLFYDFVSYICLYDKIQVEEEAENVFMLFAKGLCFKEGC